jgi:heme/copper-type cytochrome/quinol oxidase subunit 2
MMKPLLTTSILVLPAMIAASAAVASVLVPAAHAAPVAEHVNMVIVPGIRLGPDGKLHDAYTPNDMTALTGQKVVVTVYNYDTARHSFTAPALDLNQIMAPSTKGGVPAITTFSFVVHKPGRYYWRCVIPCDDAHGWAMQHDGYMAGSITIEPAS